MPRATTGAGNCGSPGTGSRWTSTSGAWLELSVELRVTPYGPVQVESRGADGPGDTRLVSFLLQWPNSTQRPVRTAWIML